MYDVRACFPLYACISVFCVDSTAWNGFSFHTFITQANILASWCTIRLYETAYMLRGDVFETMCTTHWHIRITTLYVAHQNQYTRRSYVNTHYAANANYGFHVHMCLHTHSLSLSFSYCCGENCSKAISYQKAQQYCWGPSIYVYIEATNTK